MGAVDSTTKEQCCAECWLHPDCVVAVFSGTKAHGRCAEPPGTQCCWLKTKSELAQPIRSPGVISCAPMRSPDKAEQSDVALPPGKTLPATVPGTVPQALFAAGVQPDPQFGRNQLRVFRSGTADTFTYFRTFSSPEGGCDSSVGRRCELVFDGIDTASNVSVNGHVVGCTNDMHMRWVFDVTKLLHPPSMRANNTVEVQIEPATAYAQRKAAEQGDPTCKKHERNYWPEKWGRDTQCSGYIRKNTGCVQSQPKDLCASINLVFRNRLEPVQVFWLGLCSSVRHRWYMEICVAADHHTRCH